MNSDEYEKGFVEGYAYAINKIENPLKVKDLKKGQWFKLKREPEGHIFLVTQEALGYTTHVSLNGRATRWDSNTHVVLVNPEEINFLKYCINGE